MKFYVTTPIYYVNGKPHIGHVYTAVAADVLACWQRQKGADVLFSTGTDENSQKNVEAAEAANRPVKDYVDEMARHWEGTFKKLGLTYDTFIRTTSPEHVKAVTTLLKKIEKKGDTYLSDYEGYYCVGCESFVSENDLTEGRCPIHNTKPEKIKEKNYFFKLSEYKPRLLEHYDKNPAFVQPESARKEIISYIKNEMEDVSISRQSQEWGIKLPQDKEHVVYVWFDALINYLTVTGYPWQGVRNPKLKVPDTLADFTDPAMKVPDTFWPADIHLIGKDIIKFHCAIWPAMLMSAGLPLPKKIFAHGFFTIDGQKISKSLGNAIDPLELIKDYPFDAIRYYLLRDIPFGNDGDFSHQRLRDRYNADLANGLGNLVSRTLNMIEKYWPDFNKSPIKPTAVENKRDQAESHIETLKFDQALAGIWDIIAWADLLIENKKPWELAKKGEIEEVRNALGQAFEALLAINSLIAPFLPDTHKTLTKLLKPPIKKPTEPLFLRK